MYLLQRKMMKFITVAILALVASPLTTKAEQKILVMPFVYGMSSRSLNMVKMANMLVDTGYDVTILTSPATKSILKNTKAKLREVSIYTYVS